jgi:hypothetical protein
VDRAVQPSDLTAEWPRIRALFERARIQGLHHAIASIDPDGHPRVTPIGSLLLERDRPRGFFFDIFSQRFAANLDRDPRVAVLAVDARKSLWLRSLVRGRFESAPAVRLLGRAGPRREAAPAEVERWQRRVRWFRGLRGYERLWGRLDHVRDIEFHAWEPVQLGSMTRG